MESTNRPISTGITAPAAISNINNPYARPKYSIATIGQKLINGELPSNAEFQSVLEATQRVVVRESQGEILNPHEKTILNDIRELLLDSQMMISQKNSNEKWQAFFVKHISPNSPSSTANKIVPTITGNERIQTGEPALKLGSQVRQSLSFWGSTLSTLVSSAEFRTLLLDLITFVQDIMHSEMEKHDQHITEDLKSEAHSDKHPRDTAKSVAPKVKNLMKGVSSDIRTGNLDIDPQKKELLLKRFRETLRRLAQNQNFHRSMNSMFVLFDNLVKEAGKLKHDVEQNTGNVSAPARSMWLDFCEILDEYLGKNYTSRFNANFSTLYTEVKQDTETTDWFSHFKNYIQEAMKNPEKLQNEDVVIRETEDLFRSGRHVGEKWRNHQMMQRVFRDIQKIFNRLRDDTLTNKILHDVKEFTNHMFRNELGSLDLQNSWEGFRILRYLMVPLIWEQLENFPVPKMEGETPKYKYMFDDMILKGHSILPHDIDVKFKNQSSMNFKNTPTGSSQFQMTIRMSNLNIVMENVKFYLKKKKGFPKFEDSGLLNMKVKGLQNFLKIQWVVESERGKPLFFRTKSVVSKIESVKPKFVQANHKMAFNSMTTMFGKSAIRSQVNKNIEAKIIAFFDKINSRLNEFVARRWESNRNRWLTKPIGVAPAVAERQQKKKSKKSKAKKVLPAALVGGVEGDQRQQERGVRIDERSRGVTEGDQNTSVAPVVLGQEHLRPHVVSENDKIAEDIIERRQSAPRIVTSSAEPYYYKDTFLPSTEQYQQERPQQFIGAAPITEKPVFREEKPVFREEKQLLKEPTKPNLMKEEKPLLQEQKPILGDQPSAVASGSLGDRPSTTTTGTQVARKEQESISSPALGDKIDEGSQLATKENLAKEKNPEIFIESPGDMNSKKSSVSLTVIREMSQSKRTTEAQPTVSKAPSASVSD